MKKLLKIIFVNIFLILFLFIFFEIITRIFLNFYIGESTDGLKERQSNLLYQPYVMYGPDWDYYINLKKEEKEKDIKILILGGSTAQLFPEQMIKDKFLDNFNSNVSVFNLAYGGYVANQQMINLFLNIDNINPDLIINIDGANDIIHSLRQDRPKKFLLNKTYSLLMTKPYLGPLIWIMQNSQFYNSLVRYYERSKIYDFNNKMVFLNEYIKVSEKIRLISKNFSSMYIHILQPHLEFKNLKSPEEKLFTHYDYRKQFIFNSYNFIDKELQNKKIDNSCEYIDG